MKKSHININQNDILACYYFEQFLLKFDIFALQPYIKILLNTHFFFNSLPAKYKASYRDYYTYQNPVAIRAGSLIFLLLNIIIRILYFVFPVSLTKAQNFPEFNLSNWVFIIVTP